MKCQVDQMVSWQMISCQNGKFTKCQVDKMSSWQNGKFSKLQLDKMVGW